MWWRPKGVFPFFLVLGLVSGFSGALFAQDEEPGKKEGGKKPKEAKSALEDIKDFLPLNLPQSGLTIPNLTEEGNLRSVIRAGTVTRIDDTNLLLGNLVISMYSESREIEFTMTTSAARFNVKTKVLESDVHTRVIHPDFVMEGDSMVFNTETRQGKMEGNVHMDVLRESPDLGVGDSGGEEESEEDEEAPDSPENPKPPKARSPRKPMRKQPMNKLTTRTRPWMLAGILAVLGLSQLAWSQDARSKLEDAFKALDEAKLNRLKEAAEEKKRELQGSDLEAKAREAVENYQQGTSAADKARIEAAAAALEAAKGELTEEGLRRLRMDDPEGAGEHGRPPDVVPPEAAQAKFAGTYLADLDPGQVPEMGAFPKATDDGYFNTDDTVYVTTGANGASFFDAERRLVVFTGAVQVDHPQFFIACDRLELHMRKDGEGIDNSKFHNRTIEKSIATGKRVIVEKKVEDPKDLEVGRCRRAEFDGDTGNIQLLVSPEIQKGRHVQRALEDSTVITIPPNGQPVVDGRAELILVKSPPKKTQSRRSE